MAPLVRAWTGSVTELSTNSAMVWIGRPSASFRKTSWLQSAVEIDADPVAAPDLVGCDQIRQRLHQQLFDGAFQVRAPYFGSMPSRSR